jgi:hypothetical protein
MKISKPEKRTLEHDWFCEKIYSDIIMLSLALKANRGWLKKIGGFV